MKFKITNDFEYVVLPGVFYFLTICGAWHPSDWSPFAKLLYFLYTMTQGFLSFSICLATGINLIFINIKSERFFENIFHGVSLAFGIQKYLFVKKNTKKIKKWIQVFFNDEWYKPRDEHEDTIIQNFETESRFSTEKFMKIKIKCHHYYTLQSYIRCIWSYCHLNTSYKNSESTVHNV